MYCFYTKSTGPGGVQSIQITIIERLWEMGRKCKVLDSKDSYVYNQLIKKKIEFQFFEADASNYLNYSSIANQEDLLVIFSGQFYECVKLFSKSHCKFIFWEVFYPSINQFFDSKWLPKSISKTFRKSFFNLLVRNNAIFFIDYLGKDSVEKIINTKISENQFLGIPVFINRLVNEKPINDKFTITYTGRSEKWKIYPFIKLLQDITKNNLSNIVRLNLVCDDINRFMKFLSNKIQIKEYNLTFYENLDNEELTNLLINSTLNVAMGTAALEGAKIGVPTIVIDSSWEKFPNDYRYRWIFETDKLYLGKMITNLDRSFDGKHTIVEIYNSVNHSYNIFSDKTFDYTNKYYNVDEIICRMDNYSNKASLSINNLEAHWIFSLKRIKNLLKLNERGSFWKIRRRADQ